MSTLWASVHSKTLQGEKQGADVGGFMADPVGDLHGADPDGLEQVRECLHFGDFLLKWSGGTAHPIILLLRMQISTMKTDGCYHVYAQKESV